MKRLIKVGTPSITTPNYIGEVVRETPEMWVIKLVKKTFEPKSSMVFTHTFNRAQQKHHNEGFVPTEKKFWKKSGREVGGERFIVDHKTVLPS
jgi:hypothetical protein